MVTVGRFQSSGDGKRRKGIVPFALVVTLFLALIFVSVPSAQAATYYLTDCKFTSGCGPAGTIYATVTLTAVGANVNVVVDVNNPPYAFANTAVIKDDSHPPVGYVFAFSGVGVAVGDIVNLSSADLTPTDKPLSADAGPITAGSLGSFGFGIACDLCGGGLSNAFINDITFTVNNATIADLTVANAAGTIFAADIGNTTTSLTGAVGDGVVPEPGTLYLFSGGLGMLALGSLWRRKRAAKNSI